MEALQVLRGLTRRARQARTSTPFRLSLAARRAGNTALVPELTQLAIRLSQQNLALHRARRRLLPRADRAAITPRLGEGGATARARPAAMAGAADLTMRAAGFIDTRRRRAALFGAGRSRPGGGPGLPLARCARLRLSFRPEPAPARPSHRCGASRPNPKGRRHR